MTKFLKLTRFYHIQYGGALKIHGTPVYVNMAHVTQIVSNTTDITTSVEESRLPVLERPQKDYTLICFACATNEDVDSVQVCETPEQIFAMMPEGTIG